jgi:hypothetical protein
LFGSHYLILSTIVMNGTAHVQAEGGTSQDFYDEFESYRFSDDPEFRVCYFLKLSCGDTIADL